MSSKMNNIVNMFVNSMKNSNDKKSSFDTTAEVKRVENGIAYVHFNGGANETPVKLTMDAKPGDVVKVRVSGKRAFLQGNSTAPPTDDTTAIRATNRAISAQETADVAQETAETAIDDAARAKTAADDAQTSANQAATAASNAQTSANQAATAASDAQASADNANEYAARALGNLSTVQSVTETLNWITSHGTMTLTTDIALDPTHVYFVRDNNGDYEVGSYHYSVVTEPNVDDLSTYYELSIDESLNNYVGTHLAVTSEGLWLLPDSGGNKVLIATGSGSTYTTAGTYIIEKVNNTDTVLAKFAASGAQIGTDGVGQGRAIIDSGGLRVYKKATAYDDNQIANIGYGEVVTYGGVPDYGPYYTLGQRDSSADIGYGSVVAGTMCEASEEDSYAEGNQTHATGNVSHAEGINTEATGQGAHSEGSHTHANGNHSHAEGSYTYAIGKYSHAQNRYTKASSDNQTAIGKYNTEDANDTYAVIVGNGTADNARSNALTVDWSGNVEADGDITDGSGNVLSDKADTSSLATVATSGSYSDLSDTPTLLPLFKTVTVTATVSSIGANSSKTASFAPAAQTGYTRVGIVGWNTANIHVFIATCTGTTLTFANASSSTQTCTNAQVTWLFIRSSL